MTQDRYMSAWYEKKMSQNAKIADYLISIIEKNKELGFPWGRSELKNLSYEDLFEIAVATVNRTIKVTLEEGRDWSYGADGKVAVVRRNNYGKSYSALVNAKNKKYILALVFETITEKFYFFAFPATLIQHSIPFNKDTGEPKYENYMWHYEMASFDAMAARASTWMACK